MANTKISALGALAATPAVGDVLAIVDLDDAAETKKITTANLLGGVVKGPVGSTDNAVVRYNLATGKLVQDSNVIIDDADAITGVSSIISRAVIGEELMQAGDADTAGLLKIADGTDNYISIDAPAIGADWTLTLPVDDGGAGEYLKTDGAGNTSWDTPAGGDHDILDGNIHTDSVADAVTQGSIIYGNATPKWDELVIGANGEVLMSDGTDISWQAPGIAGNHAILDGAVHNDSVADVVTRGSIIYGNSTPDWDELVIGGAGEILTSDATDAAWAAPIANVKVDVGAVADYIGAAANDGVLRVDVTNGLTWTDGGDFITIAFDADYGDISTNDGATDVTGAQLETLSDGSDADALHTHNTLVGTHSMLDGDVHTDSVADAVTRGSIIIGNDTPNWDELVVGGAGEVLTSDGTDIAWDTVGSVLNEDNVIYVSKIGNDANAGDVPYDAKLTIQAAITQAGANGAVVNNRFTVVVYPGVYAETLVMIDYVDLQGLGAFDSVEIIGVNEDALVTMSAVSSHIYNVGIHMAPTAVDATAIEIPSGMHLFQDVGINIVSATNGIKCRAVNMDNGALFMDNCRVVYNLSGSAGGALTHQVFDIQGTSILNIRDCNMVITVEDVDDIVVGFDEAAGAAITETFFFNNNFHMHLDNAAYAGTCGMFYAHGNGLNKHYRNNHIHISTDGNGTAYCYYMDTVTGGQIHSLSNHILVEGFTNNWYADVAAGDALGSHFDDIIAAQGWGGAGAYNMAMSPTDGEFYINGQFQLEDGSEGANKVLTSDADGVGAWALPVVQTSALLDGTVHTDTVADAVTRGSIIIGNSTPLWDELVIGGAGTVLGSDGTDITWGAPTVRLDQVTSPNANTLWAMTTNQLRLLFTNPAVADGGLEIEASGAFAGDLVHIHQHTGNPGAVDLLHLECDDVDVLPLRVDAANNGVIAIDITGSIQMDDGSQAIGNIIVDDGAGTGVMAWAAPIAKVKVDVGATSDYIGAAANDGTLRVTVTNGLTWTDGGNFITIAFDADYGDISGNDGATDVTGAQLEELTDGSTTVLHDHADQGTTDDHSDISANDGATDVTGAELETLSSGADADALHIHNKLKIVNKAITIEDPADDEDLTLWFTDDAITINQLAAVLIGDTGQSVTYTVRFAADRSAAGIEVDTGGDACTSVTTGDIIAAGWDDATIPADMWIWLETTAKAGNVSLFNLTIRYTVD